MASPPVGKPLAALDLSPAHLALVEAILSRHVPTRTVVGFGSRATGAARPWSDLDLAILGDERLPLIVMARLASDLEESTLPFRVDLVDWAAASAEFKARIAGVIVHSGGTETASGPDPHGAP